MNNVVEATIIELMKDNKADTARFGICNRAQRRVVWIKLFRDYELLKVMISDSIYHEVTLEELNEVNVITTLTGDDLLNKQLTLPWNHLYKGLLNNYRDNIWFAKLTVNEDGGYKFIGKDTIQMYPVRLTYPTDCNAIVAHLKSMGVESEIVDGILMVKGKPLQVTDSFHGLGMGDEIHQACLLREEMNMYRNELECKKEKLPVPTPRMNKRSYLKRHH